VATDFDDLIKNIRECSICAPFLPARTTPDRVGSTSSRLLIISQAPGIRVHETGLSFNDRSGDRLRAWIGIDRDTFYDEARVAVMPIGFCYPGRDARGGDLPPRPECAPLWHAQLRQFFTGVELTLLVGRYAIEYYLPRLKRCSVTEILQRWRDFLPEFFMLPHPSWHTIRWLRDNPWFENEAVPELRRRVAEILNPRPRSAPYPHR
jgi:uracil-DNA glycosylase